VNSGLQLQSCAAFFAQRVSKLVHLFRVGPVTDGGKILCDRSSVVVGAVLNHNRPRDIQFFQKQPDHAPSRQRTNRVEATREGGGFVVDVALNGRDKRKLLAIVKRDPDADFSRNGY
jgi:hypothetical protein